MKEADRREESKMGRKSGQRWEIERHLGMDDS